MHTTEVSCARVIIPHINDLETPQEENEHDEDADCTNCSEEWHWDTGRWEPKILLDQNSTLYNRSLAQLLGLCQDALHTPEGATVHHSGNKDVAEAKSSARATQYLLWRRACHGRAELLLSRQCRTGRGPHVLYFGYKLLRLFP